MDTTIHKIRKLSIYNNPVSSYRKNYIAWDNIERANKPQNYTDKTQLLSKNAQALLAVIVQKLRNKDKLFLNHKYISKITRCERRQNQNIIKELSGVLNINYHNSISDNGKKYRYCYKFSFKELEQAKPVNSNNLGKSNEQKISRHSIYKENKIINNRSNESNFYKFNSSSNNTDQPKYSEATRNTKTTKNGFLGSGKYLNEMLEYLTDEVCNTLRTSSGKSFTDRAIKEIAKAVSRSKQGSKAFFYHIKGFIAYLSKILKFEKRDPVKISSINYYITGNLTEEERTIHKQEKYLSEVEYSQQVTPEWLLKKRLAAVLRRDIAYKILSNYQRSERKGPIFKIYLREHVAIGEMDKHIILNQVKDTQERVWGGDNRDIEYIANVEFIFLKKREQKLEKGESEKLAEIHDKEEIKKLPAWLQIRKYFMDSSFNIRDGIGIDKCWLSKLNACEDNNKISDNIKTLNLKAESKFIRDWITSNYLFKLEAIAKELGYELYLQYC